MLRKGENIVSSVYLGTRKLSAVYQGERKIFPALISTTTGHENSPWTYSLPNRSRTTTPYTQYNYQDGTYTRTYGTPVTQNETAVISYADPNMWYYYANNSYREKSRVPIYTFSDGTFYEGESEVIREYGVDVSIWQYNDPIRTRQFIYQYSDVQKNGEFLQETAAEHLEYSGWSYNNLPNFRERIVTPYYTYSAYSPYEQRDGIPFYEQDNVKSSSTVWNYDYNLGKRSGVVTYIFDSGYSHNVTGVVQDYISKQTIDTGEYDGGECDMATFEYVDYKQQYDLYTWATSPSPTSSGLYNGPARRQKIEGLCGWVRSWSDWTNTGQLCDASGNLGYSCDGEWTVIYNRQARYYQFPDGSGVTATEYRAGAEYSRQQVHGQCGYMDPYSRAEVQYFGFSTEGQYEAYYSGLIGSIWRDENTGLYYASMSGTMLAEDGIYLINDTGSWQYSMYLNVLN
ncbi:hypothetical protein SDC9_20214 [bioreactor metagenome]|uniref:Uncharacterized protein n=1 Tax=bioreactor metagenome TaxID=1076179 RepID=A0A644U661_9ZZZZ